MINIFFVPGMFGSTIEYVLRNYTNDFYSVDGEILSDGSMHSYEKEFHLWFNDQLEDMKSFIPDNAITTPIYPFKNMHLDEIIKKYREICIFEGNYNILLHADNLNDCELNILFQYYKITLGLNKGLGIFTIPENFKEWNSEYTSWKDLQRWEYREWFSIFYPTWTSEWRDSKDIVDNDFLTINNKEFLTNPEKWTDKIINHCDLQKTNDFADFFGEWKNKQQYIIDKFNTIEMIITSVLDNTELSWCELTVIEEAIIQQKLRANGYELMCDGLNDFPCNSSELKNLIHAA